MYRDTVSMLRPRLEMFGSLEEADTAVASLQEELLAMIPKEPPPEQGGLSSIAEGGQEEEEEQGWDMEDHDELSPDSRPQASRGRVGLHTINENEEADEGGTLSGITFTLH